jgi:hypothetical protein
MTDKPEATPKPTRTQSYVKGSHTARVRSEQDERRVELLALRDVLDGQRIALVDQIEDIGAALLLLSDPGSNVVPLKAAAE